MSGLKQLSGGVRILSALRNYALILPVVAAAGCVESPTKSASPSEDAVIATVAGRIIDSVDNFLKYEAEKAPFLVGGVEVSSSGRGYFGTGYVSYPSAAGGVVLWRPEVPIFLGKEYTVTFRYSNGGTAAAVGNVVINDTGYPGLVFPKTGSWNTWSTVSVVQKLSPTLNSISVQVSSKKSLNLDCVIIN